MMESTRRALRADGLDPAEVERIVRTALIEDLGPDGLDVTSVATIPDDQAGTAEVVARAAGVVAGLSVAAAVFDLAAEIGPGRPVELRARVRDGARVARGLFTASPSADDLWAGRIHYPVHRLRPPGEQNKLPAAVQGPLTALEVEVSGAARGGTGPAAAGGGVPPAVSDDGPDLLVVDGPLRNRRQLPRTIGYVKTQHSQYLDARLTAVVTSLAAGQRSPVFHLGTAWGGWSWYLRLPGSVGAPWAGIVRVECSPDLPADEAIALADLSLVTLPRFASTPYKDPRAPQNLVPIAGLERRLRGLLGDARLLHRALTMATARTTGRR